MFASALCQNGAHVFIASRKAAQLKEVSDRLTKEGPGKCEYIVADIGTKAGCDALVAEVFKRTNKLNILINNSGTTWGAKYEDFPEAQGWDRVIATNVKAIFYLTSGLTPLLEKNATNTNPGRVINISSVAGLDPKAQDTGLADAGTGLWSYNTSKAAANHLTSTLAVTLGPKKVTVNAILPGVFPSKMTQYGIDKEGDKLAASHPMGRIGTAEDIAGLMLFLVSRSGAHTSGTLNVIDGGSLLAGRGYSEPKL